MNMPYGSRGSEHDFTTLLDGATKDELQEFIDNEDRVNEIVCDNEKVSQVTFCIFSQKVLSEAWLIYCWWPT